MPVELKFMAFGDIYRDMVQKSDQTELSQQEVVIKAAHEEMDRQV